MSGSFRRTLDKAGWHGVVGEVFDFKRFSTISGVVLVDSEGDADKFEILR